MIRNFMTTTTVVACILAATIYAASGVARADAGEQFAYHDLARVSAASPFHADCNGPDFPITAAYVNAESEANVAINPRNPRNMIAVYHEDSFPNDGYNGVLAATSFDGGRTWQVPALKDQPTFSRCAGGDVANGGDFEKANDPRIVFGADGTAYFATILWNDTNREVGQLVATSHDGGRTWGRPVAVVRTKSPDVRDASRPALTADPKREHTVYLVWARQRSAPASAVHGSTMFSRTSDGGKTWSKARAIYETPTGMQTSANQILVMPNGELVNVFNELPAAVDSGHLRHDRIALMRSSDGGLSWSRPMTVATSKLVNIFTPRTGTKVHDGDDFTDVAVDPRPGTNTIYAVWGDARFTHGQTQQIALTTSSDGGRSWKEPVAVSPEPESQQFIPAIAVNDHGDVAVTWYGFATPKSTAPGLATRYWITWSTDQGKTWAARKPITSQPFDLRTVPYSPYNDGFFLGEYQGLAATGKSFAAVMTLANGHNLDNRTDIYSCTVTLGEHVPSNTVCAAPGAHQPRQ